MLKALPPLIIGGLMLAASAPSKSEAFKALEVYAQRATLPIVTPANGGSITIVGKTGSTYTFLTAAHVIADTAKGETDSIDLSSQAGKELFAKATIKKDFRSDGIDLAVGTFQYSGKSDLEVLPLFGLAPDAKWEDDPSRYKTIAVRCDDTTLKEKFVRCNNIVKVGGNQCFDFLYGNFPCDSPPTITLKMRLSAGTYERSEAAFDNKRYDTRTGAIGDFVLAGYSLPSRSISERVLRKSYAVAKDLLSRNKGGYNLIYEATSTVPGMSGGPVVAARLCPGFSLNPAACAGKCRQGAYAGIIGVHGKSEEYGNTASRSGIGLAIPLASPVVIAYLNSNAKSLGIPASGSYGHLIEKICSSGKNFYN